MLYLIVNEINIDINQQDNEGNLNAFSALTENNKTKFNRTIIADVILDRQRDKYPSILKGELIINDGTPFQVNRF